MKKPSILVIFLTVFLDLVGFGIVLPQLPVYSKQFGASGLMVGFIVASYSIMQFFFAPIWGRWSDRVGRRPIILISTFGSVISYSIFAVASGMGGSAGLVILLASRMFAGICGANITVAQAYMADISPPEKRSKSMGLIGMAFGLGFVFGPAIGGLASGFGETVPGWVAATLCLANFILATAILKESRQPSSDPVAARPRATTWKETLSSTHVGGLIKVFFMTTFCFTCFELTLGLLIIALFQMEPEAASTKKTAGYLFAYCGIIGAMVQGGLIGRLVKTLGEPRLIITGIFLFAVSLFIIPFVGTMTTLLLGLLLLTVSSSVIRPPLFGTISQLTSDDQQGSVLGVAQGMGSLARCVGPIFAGFLFDIRPTAPYLICGVIAILAGILAAKSVKGVQLPSTASAAK